MSPTSPDNPAGFELPKPSLNEAMPPLAPAESAPVQPEQQSRQAELPGSGLPPSVPPPATPDPTQPVVPAGPPVPASPASPLNNLNPVVADDVDLIEKEWVDKAKAIVERTREDPHQQNKQLNEFKADYMKKRYGKEMRLTDE